MSAFLCDSDHISALAGFAHAQGLGGYRTLAELASDLYEANVRALRARYYSQAEDMIEPFDFDAKAAEKARSASPVAIIKAANCYAYQSCDVGDWETSQAKAIVDGIIQDAVRKLPGYDDASWGSPV